MSAKIDHADYAILYGVSEEQWPAWLLLRDETMGGVNRFWPGLPPHELTEHFFRLWSEGLIECAEGEDEPAIPPDYELARQQFEFDNSSSDRPQHNLLTYRLTPAGGDLWARYASVDWSKVYCSSYDSARNEFSLSASARAAIELALQLREISPPPIQGTEQWEILGSWQATYRKVLPTGHRISYKYESWPSVFPLHKEDEIRRWEKSWQDFSPYWTGWHKRFDAVCKEHFGGDSVELPSTRTLRLRSGQAREGARPHTVISSPASDFTRKDDLFHLQRHVFLSVVQPILAALLRDLQRHGALQAVIDLRRNAEHIVGAHIGNDEFVADETEAVLAGRKLRSSDLHFDFGDEQALVLLRNVG